MMTLSHTGGSLLLEDATASAVVRYSMALAKRSEMDVVTLDDAATPAPRSQVMLVIGMGVPLSIRTSRRAAEISDHAECGRDLDIRTTALNAPHNILAPTAEEARQELTSRIGSDSHYDYD
jgi:hypothetical protein